MACRWRRPMAIGLCSEPRTQAPSHNSWTGQTRAHVAPSKLDSRIVRADPSRFPVEIFLMNFGMSICVGQAWVQGASKHIIQRADSVIASLTVRGGRSSCSVAWTACGEGLLINEGSSGHSYHNQGWVGSQ